MRLSTSTNLLDKVFDDFGVISPERCLEIGLESGFNVFDFNFCDQGRPGRPVAQDNWYDSLVSFKKFADELGVTFSQTHLHMYDPNDPRITDHGWERELLQRSIVGTGILKADWAVTHPLHEFKENYSRQDYLKLNLDYYGPILEEADKLGFGLSFENMVQWDGTYEYACNGEDLAELVDAFKRSNAGVCWDFGHANISFCIKDQADELRLIGSRLKSTHIADNHGHADEHLAPFYGHVDWHRMMRTLKEIDYKGDFTYEIQGFSNPVPLEVRRTMTIHVADIGRYLIGVFKQ
ncbi:sugar phosphate isomerase/epimerase family protein [Paenibacillus oceani]|uniref:Sugar phosphate isomerase/epimerase n=1 Tax=Paenibacillus oceani TaxID=2772510 RepID=A0A927CCL2_9BACL|nr:sugar phosphate isomerase/epimerase [Paenibacillus oceani]MBD2863766.1 sugar phosphate isomerase/epimerase [Paenibacillus oceani]